MKSSKFIRRQKKWCYKLRRGDINKISVLNNSREKRTSLTLGEDDLMIFIFTIKPSKNIGKGCS